MRFRFNWEAFWPRLKTDYKGLLTEYDVQRDSILELCFYIARRVSEYDDMIDFLTPAKIQETLNKAAEDYFATHDFSPEIQIGVNKYFSDNPIEPKIENAVNNYLSDKDFSPEVKKAIDQYLVENPANEALIKQVMTSEIPTYLDNFLDILIIEKAQEDVVSKQDWDTEYNAGTRFVVTNTDYLYFLRQENEKAKAILITAVQSVNGQTGNVTLDAADVGAASTEDLEDLESTVSGLVTGVSSVNTKTGAVVLNAEDVGAAYIDDQESEAGPASKIDADTLNGLNIDEIKRYTVTSGEINLTSVVIGGYCATNKLWYASISLPYNVTITASSKVEPSYNCQVWGDNFLVSDGEEVFSIYPCNNQNILFIYEDVSKYVQDNYARILFMYIPQLKIIL